MMKQRTFTIYALLDPGDNLIRYVCITKDIETRFYGHTHDTPGNYEERRWVKNLKKIGMSPILEVLEVLEGANVQVIACEREHYWGSWHDLMDSARLLKTQKSRKRGYFIAFARGIRDTRWEKDFLHPIFLRKEVPIDDCFD